MREEWVERERMGRTGRDDLSVLRGYSVRSLWWRYVKSRLIFMV